MNANVMTYDEDDCDDNGNDDNNDDDGGDDYHSDDYQTTKGWPSLSKPYWYIFPLLNSFMTLLLYTGRFSL